MHSAKRRLSLVIGMSILALAIAFPATVAAARIIPPEVLGPHTWSTTTCAGKTLSVAYHVTPRGRAVFDSSSGARARVWRTGRGFFVRFRGEHTIVRVWTTWQQGVLRVRTRSWMPVCPPPTEEPSGDPPPSSDPGNDSPPG